MFRSSQAFFFFFFFFFIIIKLKSIWDSDSNPPFQIQIPQGSIFAWLLGAFSPSPQGSGGILTLCGPQWWRCRPWGCYCETRWNGRARLGRASAVQQETQGGERARGTSKHTNKHKRTNKHTTQNANKHKDGTNYEAPAEPLGARARGGVPQRSSHGSHWWRPCLLDSVGARGSEPPEVASGPGAAPKIFWWHFVYFRPARPTNSSSLLFFGMVYIIYLYCFGCRVIVAV
jgi:hypothetical protein